MAEKPKNWFDVMDHVCADMSVQPGYRWECPRGCFEFWEAMERKDKERRDMGAA